MCQRLKHRSITEFAAMSADEARALLEAARELQGAVRSGAARRVLRGKNLALLCRADEADADADADAADFQRAASALGAQVARLHAGLSEFSTPQQVQHTAHLLGRLYDGVECIGMPAELVRRIGVAAGVPVFEALSSCEHPICRLADQLAEPFEDGDRHRALIQAVLIAALA